MALNRAQISAKAAHVVKLLLLNKRRITHIVPPGVWHSTHLYTVTWSM